MKNRPHEYQESKGTLSACAHCGIGAGALVHNTSEIEAYNKVPDADSKNVSRASVHNFSKQIRGYRAIILPKTS